MNIKIWTKYQEGYLPTKRHRKMRYRTIESKEEEVVIKEITRKQTKLKYKVGNADIVEYNNILYSKVKMHRNLFYVGNDERNKDNETILGRLKHSFIGYSTFFGFKPKDTKEEIMKKAQREADKYIFIDGELWEVTNEPYYRLTTFGTGSNDVRIGVSLTVDYSKLNHSRKFKPSERNLAIKSALELAVKRGDTDSIEHIKSCPVIEVF